MMVRSNWCSGVVLRLNWPRTVVATGKVPTPPKQAVDKPVAAKTPTTPAPTAPAKAVAPPIAPAVPATPPKLVPAPAPVPTMVTPTAPPMPLAASPADLAKSVYEGRVADVERYLEAYPHTDVNTKDADGRTLLYSACRKSK